MHCLCRLCLWPPVCSDVPRTHPLPSWAASYGFLAGSGPAQRKALIVYPTILFYTVVAWLILGDSKGGLPPVTTTMEPIVATTATANVTLR